MEEEDKERQRERDREREREREYGEVDGCGRQEKRKVRCMGGLRGGGGGG